jgi:hypothetical protein
MALDWPEVARWSPMLRCFDTACLEPVDRVWAVRQDSARCDQPAGEAGGRDFAGASM